TVALAAQIRASAAASRGSTPARRAAMESRPPSELTAPLVGRAAAFSQLVASFQQVRRGQPQAVLLVGEAGIGKTRLASEFVAWAAAQGAEVLSGHTFELGGRLPYQPLVEALRPRLEAENAPEDLLEALWLAELSRLLPALSQAETLQLLEALAAEGDQAMGQASRAFASSFSERPLVALGNVLFARTAGQPLYLLETLKLWREQEWLVPRLTAEGVFRLTPTGELVAALARSGA